MECGGFLDDQTNCFDGLKSSTSPDLVSPTTQAGWSGPIKDFVEEDRLIVRKALETFIEDAKLLKYAWRDSFMLQSVLKTMKTLNEGAGIVVDENARVRFADGRWPTARRVGA